MTALADEPMDEKVKTEFEDAGGALQTVEAEHSPFSPGALLASQQQTGIVPNKPQSDRSSDYIALVPAATSMSKMDTPTQVVAADKEGGLLIYMVGPRHLFAGAKTPGLLSPADDPIEGIIGTTIAVMASEPDSVTVAKVGVVRSSNDPVTKSTGVGN
ncbi:hypothetical protein JKY72_03240 [Candidatus Gracilibacteria bacterium]|nr:hypothetical protein [Candidatus Gracilibacteria bacterium]